MNERFDPSKSYQEHYDALHAKLRADLEELHDQYSKLAKYHKNDIVLYMSPTAGYYNSYSCYNIMLGVIATVEFDSTGVYNYRMCALTRQLNGYSQNATLIIGNTCSIVSESCILGKMGTFPMDEQELHNIKEIWKK